MRVMLKQEDGPYYDLTTDGGSLGEVVDMLLRVACLPPGGPYHSEITITVFESDAKEKR